MASVCVVTPPPTVRQLGADPLPITGATLEAWVTQQGFINVYEDDPLEEGEVKGFALIDTHHMKALHIYIAVQQHPQMLFHEAYIITADGHEFFCSYAKALKYLKRHIF